MTKKTKLAELEAAYYAAFAAWEDTTHGEEAYDDAADTTTAVYAAVEVAYLAYTAALKAAEK